jgi:hypothetical protein
MPACIAMQGRNARFVTSPLCFGAPRLDRAQSPVPKSVKTDIKRDNTYLSSPCMAEVPASLMWSLDRAVRLGDPAQLMIGGSGTVSVYPRQHCYVSDIRDWDAVYAASMAQIRVAPATWGTPPPDALPLEELQWRAAFHTALAEQQSGAAVSHQLVHLLFWPNLTRLPEELIEPVTRICALLWRKPTVGYLVARVLELPQDRTAVILRVLQMFGHVMLPRADEPAAGHAACAQRSPAADSQAMAEPARAADGMVSRLWKRLLRMQEA